MTGLGSAAIEARSVASDDTLIALAGARDVTVFSGGRVLAADGVVHERADVLVQGTRIVAVHEEPVRPAAARVVDVSGHTVMPGLIDVNLRLDGSAGRADRHAADRSNDAVSLVHSAFGLHRALFGGVLTVGILGADHPEHAYALRASRREGLLSGPRILTSGRALCPIAGADAVAGRDRTATDDEHHSVPVYGEWEYRHAARRNFGEGADMIAVRVSDGGQVVAVGVEELRGVVEEAHRRRASVVVQADSPESVRNAVLAGVDSVVLGAARITTELLDLIAERGVFLVPALATQHRTATAAATAAATEAGSAAADRAERELDRRQTITADAVAAGVRIIVGSGASLHADPAALTTAELRLLVDSGMPGSAAIDAATRVAAAAIQLPGDLGAIAPGLLADLIVVRGDPLSDIACLADPGNVRHVVQTTEELTN